MDTTRPVWLKETRHTAIHPSGCGILEHLHLACCATAQQVQLCVVPGHDVSPSPAMRHLRCIYRLPIACTEAQQPKAQQAWHTTWPRPARHVSGDEQPQSSVHHARDRIELCVAVALLITQGPQTLWIDSDSASQQPYSDKRLEASGEDRSTRPSGAQAHAQRQAARVGGGVSTGRWRPGDPRPLSPFLSPRKTLAEDLLADGLCIPIQLR